MFERIERLIASETMQLILIYACGFTLATGHLTAAGLLLIFALISGKQRGDRRAAFVADQLIDLGERLPGPAAYEDPFGNLPVRNPPVGQG